MWMSTEESFVDRLRVCKPTWPLPDSGYRRTFDAEIDDHGETTLRVRGVLEDHRCRLEHEWILRPPEYEVIEAAARHIDDRQGILSPEIATRYPLICGVRLGRGFTRRVREALAELPGHQEHLALAIDMARVGQQVYKLPTGYSERFRPLAAHLPPGPSHVARIAWEQDRAYMPALRNSCYALRDETVSLFDERHVISFDPESTSPAPGQKRFFWRTKRLHITALPDGRGYRCRNGMDDTVHEIALGFDLAPDGTLTRAESQGRRVPYRGICDDAQARTLGLNGLRVDHAFVQRVGEAVGGVTGCTHLFDLAVDCLRCFAWPR
jgi:hypothetical protein